MQNPHFHRAKILVPPAFLLRNMINGHPISGKPSTWSQRSVVPSRVPGHWQVSVGQSTELDNRRCQSTLRAKWKSRKSCDLPSKMGIQHEAWKKSGGFKVCISNGDCGWIKVLEVILRFSSLRIREFQFWDGMMFSWISPIAGSHCPIKQDDFGTISFGNFGWGNPLMNRLDGDGFWSQAKVQHPVLDATQVAPGSPRWPNAMRYCVKGAHCHYMKVGSGLISELVGGSATARTCLFYPKQGRRKNNEKPLDLATSWETHGRKQAHMKPGANDAAYWWITFKRADCFSVLPSRLSESWLHKGPIGFRSSVYCEMLWQVWKRQTELWLTHGRSQSYSSLLGDILWNVYRKASIGSVKTIWP